mgnify:CR=1 FL=1
MDACNKFTMQSCGILFLKPALNGDFKQCNSDASIDKGFRIERTLSPCLTQSIFPSIKYYARQHIPGPDVEIMKCLYHRMSQL